VVIPAPAVGSGLLVNIDGDWPGANDRLWSWMKGRATWSAITRARTDGAAR